MTDKEPCDNFYKCGNYCDFVVGGGIGWCNKCIKEMGFQVVDVEEEPVRSTKQKKKEKENKK